MASAYNSFYPDGTFDAAAARAAYYAMMDQFACPVVPVLRTDEFWVTDFAQGDFAKVGMGGIFWVNNVEHGYFAHEIYLLPGQMIVEHRHHAVSDGAAKMESWHVRHGRIYTFGEGSDSDALPVALPQSQLDRAGVTARSCRAVDQGEIATLNRVTAPHFMIAGPEGAIVTEYGTPHYDDALEFTNTTVEF